MTLTTLERIVGLIAQDIGAQPRQVQAAVELLDGGATVPFIARYRKEVTGGLDDVQLRLLEDRLLYLRDLEDRRQTVIESIVSQGKMTPELEAQLWEATTKQRLEDLYLPFKPKRRTRATIAKEAGLEPLAQSLWDNPQGDPETQAQAFLNPEAGIDTTKAALDGARDIITEQLVTKTELVESLRDFVYRVGVIKSTVEPGKEQEGAKFQDYFDFSESLKTVPSHRVLAMMRGRSEGVLRLSLWVEDEEATPVLARLADQLPAHDPLVGAGAWLRQTLRWAWRVRLQPNLESDLFGLVRERAETEAISVFGTNLRQLLLASPAGHKVVLGLDPGMRTGVKCAVISETGSLLHHDVIFLFGSASQLAEAQRKLKDMVETFHVKLIAIGNGTASRETDQFVGQFIKQAALSGLTKIVVSEAGASVYSASELASQEFPDLDVSYRGAVSIARRLQDPLAELVKIDPKAIGVGQYQHDVNPTQLAKKLDSVVEDCVNAVGVDVNTASVALLERVAGMSASRAQALVQYRDENGAFVDRKSLLKVPRLGAKSFEQAAGFLRITNGINPLDASAVHPEAYDVVKRIEKATGLDVKALMGNTEVLHRLNPAEFADETFGIPTVKDILAELEKPGRDPRPEFKTAQFNDEVHDLEDLVVGMQLEGVITNVAAFGAFVDIGVHQDGLVHLSHLADRYVSNAQEVVKVGDIVKVRVIGVDLDRRRISLSMRRDDASSSGSRPSKDRARSSPQPQGAMAQALMALRKR